MRRFYHIVMADYLMRRMERCRSQIAHDSTLWAHHYEQAQRGGAGLAWPVCFMAGFTACFVVAAVLWW